MVENDFTNSFEILANQLIGILFVTDFNANIYVF